ncbi:hypothetical protein [Actinopolyspora xinjiangensis]|nr:hypothetical protein [Actinopolyspora xinjiangensis]
MPQDALPTALDHLVETAHELRHASRTVSNPYEAARAFDRSMQMTLALQDMADVLRRRARDRAEDPDNGLTNQQRAAYAETFEAFHKLVRDCIGMTAGLQGVARALDGLDRTTRDTTAGL